MDESRVQVCITRYFPASPEQVFDAFLNPTQAGRFMFATPSGQMIRAELEPRVGGKFIFVDRRETGDAEHFGEYLEIDRPHRLVFSFTATKCWDDATRVSIDIEPQETGCRLTLTHDMDPAWADYKSQTEQGWTMILDALATVLQ
jgi:uncharacterized protein YndB with AHSA1/START domain